MSKKIKAPEVKEEFDTVERCALLLEKQYPGDLKKVIKFLEKKRPGSVGRLLYNLLMEPFHGEPLIGKDEVAAMDLCKEILAAKREVNDYVIEEHIKSLENNKETVDKT